MSQSSLEKRVEALETELARLRAKVDGQEGPKKDWLNDIWGSFANDPLHEEAVRLGREYRESLRPKSRKKSKKQ